MRRIIPKAILIFLWGFAVLFPAPSLSAQEGQKGETGLEGKGEKTFLDSLVDALVKGRVHANLRTRAEWVDQKGVSNSQAYTERLRLGYGTRKFYGFSLYAEFEDIRALGYSLYNAAGLNRENNKAVIADPQDTELNQGYLSYECEKGKAILGRQRITLDDQRFIGNVGWRQNEQTYDAATFECSAVKDFGFFYSFLGRINRIYGPDAGLDYDSRSHLFHVSYDGCPYGQVALFGYLLYFDNAKTLNSNTYGGRFKGRYDFDEDLGLGYTFSYARQVDGLRSGTDYEADYWLGDLSLTKKGLGTAGAAWEILSSDHGQAAFQTPLATLHAFNGWVDAFLVTPASGLQDIYLYVGPELPYELKGKVVYHTFKTEEGGGILGYEWDAVLSKKLNKNVKVLGKVGVFDGKAGYADTTKFWLQMELTF